MIEDLPSLEAASVRWRALPRIGIDTEFVRTRTFYARLGLVQVAAGEEILLVDAVRVPSLEPIRRLLRGSTLTPVLHSCGEDLGIFLHRFGELPSRLFDTQVAASLVGLGFSISYQALVRQVLGITLEKGETRSDWTARPLSPSQIEYAGRDVLYLLPLHEFLAARLEELGRQDWAREEFDRLLDPRRYRVAPQEAFRRVKGAGRLDRRGAAVLRALCAWREKEGARRDLARPFVVRDEALLAIARGLPRRLEDLADVPRLGPRDRRRYGRALLRVTAEALQLPEDSLPEKRSPGPRVPRFGELVKGLQGLVVQIGSDLGIAPEVLAQRRVLERLVRDYVGRSSRELPAEWTGWRKDVVGEPALRYLDRAV